MLLILPTIHLVNIILNLNFIFQDANNSTSIALGTDLISRFCVCFGLVVEQIQTNKQPWQITTATKHNKRYYYNEMCIFFAILLKCQGLRNRF